MSKNNGPQEFMGAGQEQDYEDEAKLFYERLEQTGKLVDVTPDTDLASLPPNVTHIRHPDGTIERIGFS